MTGHQFLAVRLFLTLAILLWLAWPASADQMTVTGSTITLQDTARAGAVAEVIFDNRMMNGPPDNGDYTLHHRDMTATFAFKWTGGDDTIIITPPDGTVCLPVDCAMTVIEGGVGTLYLFSAEGVGM